MEITEVRIKLMEGGEDRLRGFCSITFDHSFVVRDLKIIDGNTGLFIAMPQPQADVSLSALPDQEQPSFALLQPVRDAAAGSPGRFRTGRPGQALLGRRPPDQRRLPRDDPDADHRGVPSRDRTVPATGLPFAL